LSERNCALESKAYLALRDVYENREKYLRRWKESGRKSVMTLGCDVPDEVIIAAGMLPVRCPGIYSPQPMADKYLEMSFGPLWRAMFEKIVSGENAQLYDYIAISKSSDMLTRIYYYLRELKRFEPERPIAPIAFIDLDLISRNMSAQYYNEKVTRRFIETVEGWTGAKIKAEALKHACEVCNENRSALAAFAALRRGEKCRVTGSEALTVIGASLFMEKEECTKLVNELCRDAENWPEVSAKALYFSGSQQESREVYELIEELGGNVIAEDHDWGDRHYDRNVDLSLESVSGIVDRYMFRFPSSERSFVKLRAKALADKVVDSGAGAVLVYMNFNDESYLLDYPSEKPLFEKAGIASVSVTRQRVPLENKEQLSATIKELLGAVKEGK